MKRVLAELLACAVLCLGASTAMALPTFTPTLTVTPTPSLTPTDTATMVPCEFVWISPSAGSRVDASPVDIYGGSFLPDTVVMLDGVTLTSLTFINDHHIQGLTPFHLLPGLADLEIYSASCSATVTGAYDFLDTTFTQSPSPIPSPTMTITPTPTGTVTATATSTPTNAVGGSFTDTCSVTPSSTVSASITPTPSSTATPPQGAPLTPQAPSTLVPIPMAPAGGSLLYPSPATGSLVHVALSMAQSGQLRIVILDSRGRVILVVNETLPAGPVAEPVDISHLRRGLYFYRVNMVYDDGGTQRLAGGRFAVMR
jgi:hypothetical protein